MRLVLVCVVLFLAPAGALLMTHRYVTGMESDFMTQAAQQIAGLDRILDIYPPKAEKMPSAPVIETLREIAGSGDASLVTLQVCRNQRFYSRLFPSLQTRCDQWSLFHRARWSALFGVLLAAGALALTLAARIGVERAIRRRRWPGDWTAWFIFRGLPLLVAIQVLVSMIGYGVVLRTVVETTLATVAILAVPFVLLSWIERRCVTAFVEPHQLNALRPAKVRMRARLRPYRQ